MYENVKKRPGDRKDGILLRHNSPLNRLMPHIMKYRYDALVYYEFDCDITKTEEILRSLRKSDNKNLSYTHFIMTAAARTFAEHPKLNRFIAGRKVYARKKLKFSLAAKTSISEEGKEFQTVTEVDEHDNLLEVASKFDEQLDAIMRESGQSNGTEKLLNIFTRFPCWFINLAVWVLTRLDYHGHMPLSIADGLPFYSSAYITNIGSIGGDALYHHLYEFGTTSVFIGFGKKKTVYEPKADGSVEKKLLLPFKMCLDERIAEGFDFISAMRTFTFYVENADKLLERGTADLVDPDL